MDDLSAWLNDVFLVEAEGWILFVAEAAIASPWLGACMFGLAILAGFLGRSLLVLAAAVIFASLMMTMLAVEQNQTLRFGLAGLGGLAFLFLAIGLGMLRGALSRQRTAYKRVLSEKEEIQDQLEREIRWRRAAEPDKEGAAETLARAGPL